MSNLLVHWKTSAWSQVRSHLELLSVRGNDIRSFFASPYRIGLMVLFTILFLPHVLVMVEDISLVGAYEIDPGSIVLSIQSLYQRSHFYNMNAAYHSMFYGWTYYWISFILAAPVYILIALGVLHGFYFFLIAIRLILFLIGLASLLAFFEVARRFLRHDLLAFVAGLLYIASPAVSHFFYFIHPETTGLLFLFLGILCLHKFHEGLAKDLRWYIFGLLSLVLSVLSKQVFIFTALPVLFLFLYVYCYHHNISIFRFMLSRQFCQVLFGSLVLSVFIFFIINPFAFLQPKTFLTNQSYLFSTHLQGALSEAEATEAWLDILSKMPIVSISIILSPLSLLGGVLFSNDQKVGRMLYITNLLGAVFFTFFNVISIRYIIDEGYLAPIYPLFILNMLGMSLFIVRKWDVRLLKFVTLLALTTFLSFVLIRDFSVSIPTAQARLRYKDSLAYKSYQYIETKIPDGKKIAYDYFVAIPSDKQIYACKNTQNCGTDYIEEFRPDYVIFSPNWTFSGMTVPDTARLIKYVNDHHFKLIDTISGESQGLSPAYYLEVWKKPKK